LQPWQAGDVVVFAARMQTMGPREFMPLVMGLSITAYFFFQPDQLHDLILWMRDLLADLWSQVA